jgi:uncharacterized protein DUF3828
MIDRRALIWSGTASLLGAALARGALAADDPAGIVTAIYARAAKGKGDAGGAFVIEKATRAKYLSKSLVALWAKADARTRKGDVGPVDFDPITNSQDPDVKSFKVAAEKQGADTAILAVTIESHQRDARANAADKTIRYDFVHEAGQWKIDDIKGAVDGIPWSVRALLVDSLKR